MKKLIFFAAVAAMALPGCLADKTTDNPKFTGNAIDFRTVTDKGSRAAITDATNMTGFTVTGWWDQTQTAENAYGDLTKGDYLFNAQDITRGEGATAWDYNPKRYWPAAGNVDFFAYSPASSIFLSTGFGLKDFDVDAPKIKYTVLPVSETNAQEDFLVAKLLDKTSGNVTLNFQHALSRVKFQAKKNVEEIDFVIGGISLENLYANATLDMVANAIPETGGFDYTTGTPVVLWGDHTTLSAYGLDCGNSPISVRYDAYTSVSGLTNALMVIPQATTPGEIYTKADLDSGAATFDQLQTPKTGLETAFYIKVSYKAFQGDLYYAGTPTAYKDMYIPVIVGEDEDPLVFEFGRQYTFNITFGSTGGDLGDVIEFEVRTQQWDPVTPIQLNV